MNLAENKKLIDIGFNRGYQTCFLASEYDMDVVVIDPWDDIDIGLPHIDCLMANAAGFNVADRVPDVKTGVPNTLMPNSYKQLF